MNELLNEICKAIYIDADKLHIVFETNNKQLVYCVESDCCSQAWIEHIENPEVLINEPIIEVICKDYSSVRNDDEYGNDYIDSFGYTFKTHKGYCDMEFRNSHNGYYGASIELQPEAIIKYDVTNGKKWIVYKADAIELIKLV